MLFRQTLLFHDYETSLQRLKELCTYYNNQPGDRNEAQTRLQLIDSLFFGCLAWTNDDVQVEEPHGREYADYVFSAPRRVLIVEAKREGDYFSLPAGHTRLEVPIQTLFRDYPNLKAAMEQAAGYCQRRGVRLGCVCNGHQLVAFVATRSDGSSPFDGRAVVFPTIELMLDNFQVLWDVLSKPGVENKNLQRRLISGPVPELPYKLSDTIHDYPGTISRNIFQADLQVLSDLVIEDIVKYPEHEREFLEACYSNSGALSQYALVSKKILEARYAAIFDEGIPGPTLVSATDKQGLSAELMAESLSRRPILLIGDVGVGKTMFIRNLITVEASFVFDNAITLYIDLGSQATFNDGLGAFISKDIEKQLERDHDIDIREDRFVRGIYHGNLRRFEKGIHGRYKESDPDLFRKKEIEFLEDLLADRDGHIRVSLNHISKGRKQQIVIFLDNVDQRNEETQQRCFLIAQELAEHWPATIFITMRPETYHRSQRIGAISGYHPKAFTIAPPRVIDVILKRLSFALKLTAGEIPIQRLTSIQVNLTTLGWIIRSFIYSLHANAMLSEAIDNISGGNVRVALDLVRGFFGSGHVNTEKIADIAVKSMGRYTVAHHEFVRAVIFGDNRHYSPLHSPLTNLFDLSQIDPKDHFLLPILIKVVDTIGSTLTDGGFVNFSTVYDHLQGMGFTPDQIDNAVVRAHRNMLIETGARRIPQPGQDMPHTMRVTTSGKYHVDRLCHMFAYIDAIVVDTPLLDPEAKEKIRVAFKLMDRLDRAEEFCSYLDKQWSAGDLEIDYFDWPSTSAHIYEDIRKIRVRVEQPKFIPPASSRSV